MGIAGKTRRRDKRKSERRAARQQRKELYAKYAEQGRKKGSKRITKRRGPKLVGSSHPNGVCGNIGCATCNPTFNADRQRSRRRAA
jgi:hypothetical protein